MEECIQIIWDMKIKNIKFAQLMTKENWELYRVPLIEAMLYQGKFSEADVSFREWGSSGGNYGEISKICNIANTLGASTLSTSWQAIGGN